MESEDGTSNADNTESCEAVRCLKSESVNNTVTVKKDVSEGVQSLERAGVNNGVVIADGNDVAEGDSGGVESFRTYKRRKHLKLSSESRAQEDCRAYAEDASHRTDQVCSPPFPPPPPPPNYVHLGRPVFVF